MPNEILGTGLSGLVGSRLIELNPQYQFTDLSLDTGYDILNFSQLEVAFNNFSGNIVLHLAAFTDTNAAWEQRGDKDGLCYRLNVLGTKNIINFCKKYQKYLIFVSTDFVFDGTKTGEYTEEDSPHPIEWYGQTKYEAEKLVVDSGIPAVILRIASPYRAKFDSKIDFIRKIIAKLAQKQPCNLFTDQITTPTFIDDIALAFPKIVDQLPTGIYHLVASSSQSIFSLGQSIIKIFGFDQQLITPGSLADYLKTPNVRPFSQNLALSNNKVKQLGIPMSDLESGLLKLKQQLSPLP